MLKQLTQSDKDLIGQMLTQWGSIMYPRAPKDPMGHLDTRKLNKLSETKTLVNALKSMGIESASDLRDLGFLVASLVLKF